MPTGLSLTSVLAGAVASSVLSNVLGIGGEKGAGPAPAAPAVTPPTPMPIPGDAATKAAERASIAEQLRRRGRASTILTDQTATTDKLGG